MYVSLEKIITFFERNQDIPAPMNTPTKHDIAKKKIVDSARILIAERGFSGVGLSQILEVAGIPKGSFYHYFASKEVFGEELLRSYMHDYLINIQELFSCPDKNSAQKLFSYLDFWRLSHVKGQVGDKCLIVKLAAEVSDISERMRRIMETGTAAVITHLSQVIKAGQQDKSIHSSLPAHKLASSLYQLWLGATLMTKITHSSHPLDEAWQTSRILLGCSTDEINPNARMGE